MPSQPHEPRSHDPAHDADDSVAATSTATYYRACLADVDPDAVLRSIRLCNGFRSWSLAPCEIYQLAHCTLNLYEHHERAPELVLDGPDPDEIRNVLTRLGFEPHDVVITALQPAEDSP